ncbi:hypothetical protein COY17_00040 [Candidatus Saccharibacteria bacterium CG_4_10_14_0_2_um_filter_52_9]|nr:MAG: hypothetical protein COY17_00040 [Candidatus Saccharibacteria bacterium CG_4_10_14_0_2_um_filter_52_9]
MKYVLTTGWEDGVAALAERLGRELGEGRRVLWLVSGGSNITASAQIATTLSPDLSRNLSVMLVDERYGSVGHADSNWAQLMEAGFDAGQASLLPILEAGLDFDQTVERFGLLANKAFDKHDLVIAQLGIGDDGHIAGILPDSPATSEQQSLVAGFKTPSLQRLTLTFPALRQIDVAYAFAFGEPKLAALTALKTQSLSLAEQPSQILKELPEAYLYSDQIGDES